MGVASLRLLGRDYSPRVHTLRPAILITRIDVLRPTPLCARRSIVTVTQKQAGQGCLKRRITSTTLQGRRKQSIKESFVVGVASL